MWIDRETGQKAQLVSMDNNAVYKIGDAEITVTASEFNSKFREATRDEIDGAKTASQKEPDKKTV